MGEDWESSFQGSIPRSFTNDSGHIVEQEGYFSDDRMGVLRSMTPCRSGF